MSLNENLAAWNLRPWDNKKFNSFACYSSGSVMQIAQNITGVPISLLSSQPVSAMYLSYPDISPQSLTASVLCNFPRTSSETKTRSLSASESSNVLFLNSSAAACTYTLPSVSANTGTKFSFIVNGGSLSNAITIAAGSAIIKGQLVASATTGASTSASSNIVVGTSAAIGDKLDLISDGSAWLLTGIIDSKANVTFS